MYSSTLALQSAYSRAPSFWESQNMDNTTLDFFPSGVRPLMPFLAFIDRRESMALNLPLVLFQSLFSIVLCWLQREVRPDRTELVLELSDMTIGASLDSTSCNSSSVSLSKSEGSLAEWYPSRLPAAAWRASHSSPGPPATFLAKCLSARHVMPRPRDSGSLGVMMDCLLSFWNLVSTIRS